MAKKLMLKNKDGFADYLRVAYIEKKKPMREIADEVGCSPATILYQLKLHGIETRGKHDYETSDKVREMWREIGRAKKGAHISEEQKQAISKRNKGRRKRTDYEFGGHEKLRKDGYIYVYVPNHPNATIEGYVMKHRLVMERHTGQYIPKGYVVHHKNKIKTDNRIENLVLMTFSEHARLHMNEMRKGK